MEHDGDKRLYLIDGHALAYRSFFATLRAPMTNAQGQATGAVFGFANAVLRLTQQYRCPYIAAVFDSPKPTFRHEMYPQYKANREEMPEDMRSQIPLIYRLVDALNIPRLSLDGFEADDIIAWLARRAAAEDYRVWIISRDKDLMQLVDERVHLLAPEGGGELTDFGPAQVEEKMGVPPSRIRDLLALMGDSSDNVPGIKGVGPKTAVKMLQAAQSVERLLADPSLAGNLKLQEKVLRSRPEIELSLKLVTLAAEPPLDFLPADLKTRPADKNACVALFRELEFGSLLRNPLFDTKQDITTAVRVPSNLAQLDELVERIHRSGRMSLDTETNSLEPHEAELVGISIAVDEREGWYIPVGHSVEIERNLPLGQVLERLRPVLESVEIAKVGQNLKYDCQVLRRCGITVAGLAFDTMVAAYVLDPGRRQYGLDDLAAQFLGGSMTSIESLIGKRGKDQLTFDKVPVDDAAKYSAADAVVPHRLRAVLEPSLREREQYALFSDLEMKLVGVLADMEWIGIAVDTQLLSTLSKEYGAELERIRRDIYTIAGCEFNLNSPKQIADVLYEQMGLRKGKRTKTGVSTDVDALERLAPEHPVAQRILDYREIQKLLSTYIDALPGQISPADGRVHTSFNQTIAATGRLSSTDPNLQNIPVRTDAGVRIREAFVAPEGYVLVSADYSQIELRLLAHLSGDQFLCKAFEEDRDIHTQTASAMYGVFPEMVTPQMRRAAKTINFGLMYGMGPINLSRQLGISFKEAQEFIDNYFRQFPAIHAFMEKCIAEARERGYSQTVLGRRRYLPDISSERRQVREAAERTAINTPVQGSAADIIKIAMVGIHRELPARFPSTRMILQVHDELVFETPEQDAAQLKAWACERMSAAFVLCVPLKVDAGIGKNWRQAH